MSADGFTLKTADGRALRFEPAPHDIEVVDVWAPGRFSATVQDAYERMRASGRIRELSRHMDAAGRVCVRYMADIPAEWIHEELRAAKYAGKQIGL